MLYLVYSVQSTTTARHEFVWLIAGNARKLFLFLFRLWRSQLSLRIATFLIHLYSVALSPGRALRKKPQHQISNTPIFLFEIVIRLQSKLKENRHNRQTSKIRTYHFEFRYIKLLCKSKLRAGAADAAKIEQRNGRQLETIVKWVTALSLPLLRQNREKMVKEILKRNKKKKK